MLMINIVIKIMLIKVKLMIIMLIRLQSEYEAQISEWGALEAIVLQQDRSVFLSLFVDHHHLIEIIDDDHSEVITTGC